MVNDFLDAIEAALPAGTPFRRGVKHLSAHARPPQIITVAATELIGPGETWRDPSGQPLTSLYTRTITLEHYLWGRSEAEVEQLLHEYLAILRGIAGMQSQPASGLWLGYEDPSWLQFGECYVLRTTLAVPVIKPERFGVLEEIAQLCCEEEP